MKLGPPWVEAERLMAELGALKQAQAVGLRYQL